MDHTLNLELPYLFGSQAQKHVTHNEALRRLDQLVQVAVLTRSGPAAPPATPAEGERYIVPASAEETWAGHDGELATFVDGAWSIVAPKPGWLVWVEDEAVLLVHDGAGFVRANDSLEEIDKLGINATADNTNRLAVASAASLFTHEGQGHQIKLNKAVAAATGSILFQTNFSGRAEFGLAGDDNWHVKVSADGATWREAMVVDAASGAATFPRGLRLGASPALLDRYEEGSWAPQLVGSVNAGAPTYASNAATFLRIGKMVVVNGRMVWTSLGGLDGYVSLAGLPFPCRTGSTSRYMMYSSWYNGLAMGTGVTMFGGYTEPGTNYFRLWGASDAGEGTNLFLQDEHLSQDGEFYFGALYLTD